MKKLLVVLMVLGVAAVSAETIENPFVARSKVVAGFANPIYLLSYIPPERGMSPELSLGIDFTANKATLRSANVHNLGDNTDRWIEVEEGDVIDASLFKGRKDFLPIPEYRDGEWLYHTIEVVKGDIFYLALMGEEFVWDDVAEDGYSFVPYYGWLKIEYRGNGVLRLLGSRIEFAEGMVVGSTETSHGMADLPLTASAKSVEAEVGRFADSRVRSIIGSDAERYRAFRQWAMTVGDGESEVLVSTNAAVSYLLGAERVFRKEPKICISEGGTIDGLMSMTIRVKDGDETVPCDVQKVAGMVEATTSLRDWSGGSAIPLEVECSRINGDGDMKVNIRPAERHDAVFFRVRVGE